MNEQISAREKFSYGIGAAGKDLYFTFLSTYAMVFFTDVAGVAAAAIGTLLLVGRIWDAAYDPIMGVIVDKTTSRWGKFRPYLLFIPPVLGGLMIALFSTPHFGATGNLIWIYATYILTFMAYTAFDVPIMSLSAVITNDPGQRTSLITISRIVTLISSAAVGIAALPIISLLGGGNDSRGYLLFTMALVAISMICSWLAFFNTKERVAPNRAENSFKDYMKILRNNQPFLIIICASVLFTIGFSTASGVTIYYLKYVLKNPDIIPIIMAVSILLPLASMPFVPAVSKRLGKKRTMIFGLLGLGLPIGVKFFFPNVTMQIALSSVQGFGFATAMVVLTSMIADTVDYAQWKTGSRSEGLIFSINTFSTKLGTALSGALIGYLLNFIGYIPNVEQSQLSLTGINVMYSLIPGAFIVLPALLLLKYPITEAKFTEITRELAQRDPVVIGESSTSITSIHT